MATVNKANFQISVPVSIFREGEYFVAYSPLLDLSTSGKTFEEVQKRFPEIVQIFIRELVERGTVDKVLTDLGWTKLNKQWSPPVLISQESASITIPNFA